MLKLQCLWAWPLLLTFWTFLGVRAGQDFDVQTDFSRYRSFDFEDPLRNHTGTSFPENPFLMRRIRDAIKGALGARGFRKVSERSPDFYVAYYWTTAARIEVDYDGDGWFGRRYLGDSAFGTAIVEYEEGTLTIDFLDAESKTLLWRGTGTRRINSSSSPQQSTETIQKWVTRILKQYPPGRQVSKAARSGCAYTPQRPSPQPQQS